MPTSEYLVSYGRHGDFGRFRADSASTRRRGDRVVIQSPRGLEVGAVIRRFDSDPHSMLAQAPVGQIVRAVSEADDAAVGRCHQRAEELFGHGRREARALELPFEVVDAEVLLGSQGILLL
jgi:hypothetical protein